MTSCLPETMVGARYVTRLRIFALTMTTPLTAFAASSAKPATSV